MAIETLYKCELDNRAYLQLTETNSQKGNLTIITTDHNISNMVVLTKNDVKKLIQDQLLVDLAQTEYTQTLEKLSDLTYQTPDSLKPVAKALNLNIEKSELFSRKGGNTELTKSKQVINAAFSHDVLTLGNNSETVQLNNDGVVVVRVSKHILAAETSLDEVKPIIEKKIALIKARNEAKRLGEELSSTMNDVTKYNELLTFNWD
jgi:peptidyl-prolyl cis-trans isomerase D